MLTLGRFPGQQLHVAGQQPDVPGLAGHQLHVSGAVRGPRVLQPGVRTGGHRVPVRHPAGRRARQHHGGGDRARHQVPPHHHQLLPRQPRRRRPHHPTLLRAAGLQTFSFRIKKLDLNQVSKTG